MGRKTLRHHITQEFWNNEISMYLDGKGFEYKQNPRDQARAPKACEWRKKSEGLNYGCTSKGKKEGCVNANFMVAISFNKGVVLCEQYFGHITGQKVADLIKEKFADAFKNSVNSLCKRILMDGCPRQNSKVAVKAIEDIGGMIFRIPARSPDLNSIENFFNLITRKLQEDAINFDINKESFVDFSERVKQTMASYPIATIDNVILSMDKRIKQVLKKNGQRIKY